MSRYGMMNYHASDRNKLQTQLNIIDRAIDLASDEKAVDSKARTGTSKLESQGVIRSVRNIENGDVSFIINTQQLELSVCPDCLQEVEQKKMKIHNLQYCGNRMVQCPSLGCGKLIHRCNLPYHLKEECLVAVTRKNLLASAAQRAAIKSDLDAQILESSQHQRHSVILQNSLFRDQEEIKMVEPKVLICSQCGEGIRESHLADHMQRTCFFRPVACPNYTLGCGEAAISLNRIQMHLFQECNVEKRKNQMVTNSKKRNELIKCSTCGYQVELRFWKQHESEQCENRLVTCKNHPLGCSVMVPLSERNLHETLDESYERFCLYFSGHGSFLQIEESDISCPWTAEYWIYRPLPQDSLRVHLRNMLSLISSYEVAYLSEFLTWRKVMKVVNVLKDDALVSKPASQDGKKLSKAERQQIQQEQMQIKVNLINELTSLIPVYSDAALAYIRAFQQIAICIEASRDCLKELAVANHDAWNQESDLSLQTEYPGSLATISKPKTSFGETKSEKAGNVTARSLTLQEDVDRITAARTNISDSHDDFFEAVTIQAKVNQSPVAKSILFSGQSIIAQYYKICYLSILYPQNKSQGESVDVVPGESFVQMAEKRQLEDKFVKLFGYTQLPDPTICQFLIGFLLEPITTISKFAFQPKIWKRLLETFAILLKIDFDDLQDWRIEAGLLSIDASTATTRTKLTRSPTDGVTEQIGKEVTIDIDEEMDKKRKKKEKERQRRELKKIQSRRQVEEEVDSPSSLKASKEGESENGPSFERNGNGLEMGKPERRLIERITELIKSGCGCEVLNDSNSVNQLSHRSHFCIAMYSGLSVLLETEDESGSMFSSLSSKTEKNHYYELIIPPKEFTRLAEMQGQLGFVSAFELKVEQVTEQEILLRELLGTQAVKTEAKVTRGRWSHIAFCATRQPQNRGLVYLDGNLVGNFKDSAFSLPMLSLGGSPFNIFSFSGLILDAKYWSYVRSAREIREKMHSLITLTLNKITNSAADQMLQTISPTQTTKKLSSQFTSEIPEDFGLIAWWTMDDGPGFDIVTDVTRHRFKTRIMNHVEVNYQWSGAEETKYNIPALILSELPESMLQLKNLKTFQNFVKPDTPSAENKRRIVINDKITIIDDPLLSEETAKCSPVSSHSEVEGFHKSNIVHSVQLKFDGLFEDYRETVKKGPTTSPSTRLKYQNLLQHFTQFKWIKAETVKSLVSLLAYDIPKTPQSVKALLRQESKSDVVFQDDDQPKKLEERISTIKPRKSHLEKKIRKKEGKSSKLPSYLLEESINRSLDGSEVAPQTTLPIPSFREQNICPFELRRHRLARYGRELQKYVVCPLNCSQMVKKISVRFHMQFECLRRYVSCYYDGCNMIFPLNERMQHEKKDCMILQRRIQLLDEAKEKNQQILCSRCSEEIQLRHYDEHQKNECSHRMIFCPNADCSFGEVPRFRKDGQGVSARLPYHLLQHHLRFDCDSINIKHR